MNNIRVVIVTGAGGSGCGRAIAARLARGGAAVVASDINETGGHETVRVIERAGGRAAFCRADVLLVWWSEDAPQLIRWGDRGYRDLVAFDGGHATG